MDTKHFLSEHIEGEGAPGFATEPCYNRTVDCLVFKAEDVAVVADWVDEILTLYESAEDGRTIGFKIKGVKHIFREMGCDAMAVGAETDKSGEIVSVGMMLLRAYEREKPTISRRAGYPRALESLGADFQLPREELVTPRGLGG